jgi:hypothetical protein
MVFSPSRNAAIVLDGSHRQVVEFPLVLAADLDQDESRNREFNNYDGDEKDKIDAWSRHND